MKDNLVILFMGLILIVLGITNIKYNASSIHWYNRRKVSDEDMPNYSRTMGIGTVMIGVSITVAAILRFITDNLLFTFALIPGIISGLIIMLYAQFKYSKGLF